MGFLQFIMQDVPVTVATTSDAELTLLDFAIKGGWVMIPIVLLSFVAVYIFIERYYVIRKATKEDQNFMNRIKDYIHDGKVEAALALCRSTNSPGARMVEKGIPGWAGLCRIFRQRLKTWVNLKFRSWKKASPRWQQ